MPKKLTLKAIVVMPLKNQNGTVSRQTEAFMQELRVPENRRLLIPDSADQIELGYVFRNDGASPENLFRPVSCHHPVVAAVCYTVLKNRRTILWQKKCGTKMLHVSAMM